MKDKARARELAVALTSVARAMGKPARAVMTAMDEPLGRAVGNALEVAESIACLRGSGPPDLMEVTFALGEQMLLLTGAAKDAAAARALLERSLCNGSALEKFRAMLEAQGGDPRVVDEPGRLPQAGLMSPLPSPRAGHVASVDAMGVAIAALRLGAGRAKAADSVDPAVGIADLVKAGDRVKTGENLCTIHASSAAAMKEAAGILAGAIQVADTKPARAALIGEIIG